MSCISLVISCLKFHVYSINVTLQGAIAQAGGVKALVDLIFKWSNGGEGVLVCQLLFRTSQDAHALTCILSLATVVHE